VVSDARPDAFGDVTLEHLMDDPFYVALPRDHPLATEGELRMEDLRDETWIEGHNCSGPLIREAAAAGFEPRIAFDSSEWLGKQGLVAAGVGVTLIPTLALGTVREGIVLRSLGERGPRRRVLLATHASLSRAPAIEPMKAILRRVAQEHCFTCDALVAP
jgi:DNA-binding transcriptional LysR family regulator